MILANEYDMFTFLKGIMKNYSKLLPTQQEVQKIWNRGYQAFQIVPMCIYFDVYLKWTVSRFRDDVGLIKICLSDVESSNRNGPNYKVLFALSANSGRIQRNQPLNCFPQLLFIIEYLYQTTHKTIYFKIYAWNPSITFLRGHRSLTLPTKPVCCGRLHNKQFH